MKKNEVKKEKWRDKRYTYRVMLFTGIIITCFAVITFFAVQELLKTLIRNGLELEEGSESLHSWANPTAKILRKYYFYDIQNPDKVLQGLEKPKLIEKGPYTYRVVKSVKNMKFHSENLFTYSPVVSLFFEPSMSIGNESDMLTILNIPAATVIDKAIKEQAGYDNDGHINFGFVALNGIIEYLAVRIFLRRSVGEFVRGYEDQLLSFGNAITPNMIPTNKFSLLNGENNTVRENLTIMTGMDDINNVGKIVQWNGLKKLDFWDNDAANEIKGTDGSLFSPNRKRIDKLAIFASALCRSVPIEYARDNFVDGFNTLEYHLPKNVFYNSSLNPSNEGLCTECIGNGVQEIGKCSSDAPIFASLPHFLNAEQKFLDAVDGLSPHNEKHDFTLNFEPNTGAPISGFARLQVNVLVHGNRNIYLVRHLKTVLLPICWAEVSFIHHPETRDKLLGVAFVSRMNILIPSVILIVGSLICLLSIILLAIDRFFKKDVKKDVNKNVKYDIVNVKTSV